MSAPPTSPAGGTLRVLQSVTPPTAQTNPYVVQLVESLSRIPDVDVRYFSWRRGLLGRYDVFHVHWPEVIVRREGRLAGLAALTRFLLLLVRLQVRRRIAVVRTLHNVGAHEAGHRFERLLLAWFDRRTDHWIALNGHTPTARPDRVTLIPHGDYRDWFRHHEVPPPTDGRLLYFGLIRPYKGVDRLLAAFGALNEPDLRLRVVGRPAARQLATLVQAACRTDPRVTATLEYVDDATLAREIGAAQLVVLPYDDMHNSGALMLALSLGRPVLVPASPVTSELADEVGEDWVITYAGPLTEGELAKALAAVRGRRLATVPDLARRRWSLIAAAHETCYRHVVRRPLV